MIEMNIIESMIDELFMEKDADNQNASEKERLNFALGAIETIFDCYETELVEEYGETATELFKAELISEWRLAFKR